MSDADRLDRRIDRLDGRIDNLALKLAEVLGELAATRRRETGPPLRSAQPGWTSKPGGDKSGED
jgi:hypothetical protein